MGRGQERPDGRGIALQLSGPVRSASVQTTSRFRADVEGLRAVAVLAVVVYHAGLSQVGGGFVGVDVFYVLSGFLITGLLWEELQTTAGLRLGAFYGRRARRLLPAAVLVLMVTLAASWVWLSPLQARGAARDAAAAALYVANYRFALQRTDYLADASPSPLQHYWSLGVEEQFYLLWPLLLLVVFLAARRGRRSATRAAGAAVLAVVASGSFVLSGRGDPWLAWPGGDGVVDHPVRSGHAVPGAGGAVPGCRHHGGARRRLRRPPVRPRPGAGVAAPPGRRPALLCLVPVALAAAGPGPGGGRPPARSGAEPRPGRRRRAARPSHRETGRGPGAVLASAAGTPG